MTLPFMSDLLALGQVRLAYMGYQSGQCCRLHHQAATQLGQRVNTDIHFGIHDTVKATDQCEP